MGQPASKDASVSSDQSQQQPSQQSQNQQQQPPLYQTAQSSPREIDEIVTVTAAKEPRRKLDNDIFALQQIKGFSPLFPNSVENGWKDLVAKGSASFSLADPLKPDALLRICAEFQGYLRNWSATVAHEQKLLGDEINDVDTLAKQCCAKATTDLIQWKQHSRVIAQEHASISDLSKQIKDMMYATTKMLESLNAELPREDQLLSIADELSNQ